MSFNVKTILAFFGIYVIWGSTYLAIRFTLETLPPLISSGLRFFLAGIILYIFVRLTSKVENPTLPQWRSASIIGGFLILGGNGNVVLAEQYVPSGVAALIIATIPVWMVILEWLWLKQLPPSKTTWVGIGLGFLGVAVLIVPDLTSKTFHLHPMGVMGLLLAALLWSIGSLYAKKLDLPQSVILATSMEMIIGGMMMVCVGFIRGEWTSVHLELFSVKSIVAFIYLTLCGSLWGFTAYIWLLKNVGAVRVSSYAFVNPIVAIILGYMLAGEHLNAQIVTAAMLVVAAVCIITFFKNSSKIRLGKD
jgi:drug/metabolite transporter (DMT)-like permease